MRNAAIADASLFYALYDRSDAYHDEAIEYLRQSGRQLYTTLAAVTEVAYMLGKTPPTRLSFLSWIHGGGAIVVDLNPTDFALSIEVLAKYADLRPDFADATLAAIANRLEIQEVATFDSDFRVYKYQRRRHFKTPLLDVN